MNFCVSMLMTSSCCYAYLVCRYYVVYLHVVWFEVRHKNLSFPETRSTLVFTPNPKNFMDFILLDCKKTPLYRPYF